MTTRPSSSYGWGIIGTGVLVDRFVAPAINSSNGNHIGAVLSRDETRARDFADRHGGERWSTSYKALLDDDDIDIVYVASPNSLHAPQTQMAIAAGKHVLVEKPMALTLDDALQMDSAAQDAGVTLGVGFHMRHKRSLVAAREAILAGRIGAPFVAQVEIGGNKSFYPFDTWRGDISQSGGGAVLNQGVHGFDLARFLWGSEIASVTAKLSNYTPEDVFLGWCHMADGSDVSVITHQNLGGTRSDLVIYGDEGWIEIREATKPGPDEVALLKTASGEETLERSEHTAYHYEVGRFADAIGGGEPFGASGHDGAKAVAAAEAIYESAEQRRSVDLDEIPSSGEA